VQFFSGHLYSDTAMFKLLRILFGTKNMQSYTQGHYNGPIIFYIILSLIVISIPAISTYLLVTFCLDKHVLTFIPQWSDEIINWHQAATFKVAGFHGGYYTMNELPAPARFIHFYAHGPIYPMLAGSLGHIIGWKTNSPILLNIIFITLAIASFIRLTKPNSIQLLLIGLTLLTFWPIHLYMATSMREVLFESLAIIMAGLFYKTLSNADEASYLHLVVFFITIALLALLKISNAIFFIPYFLLIRRRIGMSSLQATVISIVLIALSNFMDNQMNAPYPISFVSHLSSTFSVSFNTALQELFQNTILNVRDFFNMNHPNLWLMLRCQVLLFVMAGFWFLWGEPKDMPTKQEGIFVLTSTAISAILIIVLYDVFDWKDFRLFAPIVLMITMLFIARWRVILVALIIAGNLLLLPHFLSTYKTLMDGGFPDTQTARDIEAFSAEIAPVISYNKAGDAWSNTVLAPVEIASDRRMLGVPAGIGISTFISPDSMPEIKSRYLLLDKRNYEILKYRVPLEFKLTTDIGVLFVNKNKDQ
jgi:hypothetical protein